MSQNRFIFIFAATTLSLNMGLAHADNNSTEQEFRIKQEYMHERVDDFYRRLDEMDRQEQLRQSKAGDMKKQRSEIAKEEEKSRLEYVKQRKAKPPEDPTAWEKEISERKRVYDISRKEFVKRRDVYNKESQNFDTIPPEEELGIDHEEDATPTQK